MFLRKKIKKSKNVLERHMKNKLENRRKTSEASLNSSPLNLPEDKMNSIAELRMKVLTLELRLRSP